MSHDAVPRPRLDHLPAAARAARLTTVVAPAGYGKTTLLASWSGHAAVAWHTVTERDTSEHGLLTRVADVLRTALPALRFDPPAVLADDEEAGDAGRTDRAHALAGALCEAVAAAARGREPLLLVLDDVHLVSTQAGPLVEALCLQAPDSLRLVLAGREPPRFPVRRMRARSELLEVTAAQLAFTEQETGWLLGGSGSPEAVHRATGGWPVAVRMIAEALRRDPAAGAQLTPETLPRADALYDYLAHEIFDREPLPVRELLAAAALFDRFTPALLAALGFADAGDVLTDLVDRGLFLERLVDRPGWLGLVPLARAFAAGLAPVDAADLRLRAGGWFAARGHLAEAFAALAALPDRDPLRRLLAEQGERVLHHGGAGAVLAAVEHIPVAERDTTTWQLAGAAHQVRGEWGPALACLRRAAAAFDRVPAALAVRIAGMHYFSGDPDRALAACADCADTGSDPEAESRVHSIAASAHWARGEVEQGREAVAKAVSAAERSGDDAALAAAHTVLAMLANAEGDRAGVVAHYQAALAHARLAGDTLAEIRVRVNRSAHFVHEAHHREALEELEVALRLADLTGFTGYRALGLNNRGAALLGLGRLDEAAADLRAARAVYTDTGSRLASLSIESLAEVHRLRGERALSRAAFEEAIRLAEANGATPQLVPALAGLARLLADEDPDAAGAHAARALACGTGFGYPAALLAAARVALARRDRDGASSYAAQARTEASARGDRAALAESLELLGRTRSDREQALALLDQAAALWQDIGNPLGDVAVSAARAEVLGDVDGAALAEVAEQAALRIGARGPAARAAAVAARCHHAERPAVSIRALGAFRVLRHGEPVPATAWQSRKARDLVKILVARRGRPTSREALMELLWPGEPPERLGNRFSVALSTARSVLDPRRGDAHGIVADADQVRLDQAVDVDVWRFLADASAGLGGGRHQAAATLLAAAETAYAGDFLEEDPYADWAVELREDARLTYLQVAAALAGHAAATGDHVAAGRYCLRVLERDRYDETAHLALVRALSAMGSHGEARRRHRAYVRRMREIGVEPSPFPGATPVPDHALRYPA